MAKKKKTGVTEVVAETVSFKDQFLEDGILYGTYVAQERALPDIRDGLKPVARRILYTMLSSGNRSDKPYRKSALLVGKVMGELHPHGDQAIYKTMIGLSREWANWFPLVEIKGNKGTFWGYGFAAQRYTECRSSKLTEQIFELLNKESTDWVPNYSEDLEEPVVLPNLIPLLLINGTYGISVGFTSSVPQHNPRDVIRAYLEFCKKKNPTLDQILEILQAPDFPSGGEVYNLTGLRSFYETGKGILKVRGITEIEGDTVVITQVPATLAGGVKGFYENLLDQVQEKKITLAAGVSESSNGDGIRIEVRAKSKDLVEQLEAELYAKTALQSSQGLYFNVVQEGIPTTVNLMEYLETIREFSFETIARNAKGELERVSSRLENRKGFLRVMDVIDPVIALIKNSPSQAATIKALTKGEVPDGVLKTKKDLKTIQSLKLSEEQAKAILDTRLARLSKLSKLEIEAEIKMLEKEADRLTPLVVDRVAQNKELQRYLKRFLKYLEADARYERKTKISEKGEIRFTPVVEKRQVNLGLTKLGYLKASQAPLDGDFIWKRDQVDTDQLFYQFASDGKLYQRLVDDLGTHTAREKGTSLSGFLKLGTSSYLVGTPLLSLSETQSVILVSSDGLIKSVPGASLLSSRKVIQGTKLRDGADLIAAIPAEDNKTLLLKTEQGEVKRLKLSDIPAKTRTALGVQSGRLKLGDRLKEALLVGDSDTETVAGKTFTVSDLAVSALSNRFRKM